MHAFLIIGNNTELLKNRAEKLAKSLQAKVMPYPLQKVEDAKELSKFTRLSVDGKTLLFIESVHEATTETLNAFLKSLEEPQENLFFALTAPSIRKVLPTIVSRCQIIKVESGKNTLENEDEIKEFLEGTLGQKLSFFDKIKDREKAIGFVENLIYYLHEKRELANMEAISKTLTRLKANGNVNLHLSNLAINFK